ncbi:MAG TPA: hypothetical protein EYQ00_00070, partial [Dehalococcoidia bacterium]|nr:hypothetical protein [Dehalococcoidia bacterium]
MTHEEHVDVSVGYSTASDGVNNICWNKSGSYMSSMEQFITPVRIEKNHPVGATLPGFRPPNVNYEDGKFGNSAVGPTLDELDPYFPKILIINPGENREIADDGTQFMRENDYRMINHNMVGTDSDFNIRDAEDAVPGTREAISVVQPMSALRGPLIMSGWGFGMDDLPAPSEEGEYPANTKFDGRMTDDRRKWKTGPVHLMWDDERQVWQGGYHIVCGVVDGAITAPSSVCDPTRFNVKLLRNTQRVLEGSGGIPEKLSNQRGEQITVTNRDPSLEQEEQPDSIFCMAIKLNY